jgi:uncharacterized membrane protein
LYVQKSFSTLREISSSLSVGGDTEGSGRTQQKKASSSAFVHIAISWRRPAISGCVLIQKFSKAAPNDASSNSNWFD